MTVIPVRVGRHRYELHAPAGDHIGNAVRASGEPYERDLLRVLGPFVHPESVVIDVGANIGNHALYFAITRGALVHAFEPNPTSRRYLHESLEANHIDRVIIHPEGLSDWRGTASLVQQEDLGMVSLTPSPDGEIQVARLDDFEFPLEPRITVVKIDVEGDEAAILDGATRTLKEHQPLIAIEAFTKSDRRRVEAALPPGYRRLPMRFCWTPTYVYYPRLRNLPSLLLLGAYAKVVQYGK